MESQQMPSPSEWISMRLTRLTEEGCSRGLSADEVREMLALQRIHLVDTNGTAKAEPRAMETPAVAPIPEPRRRGIATQGNFWPMRVYSALEQHGKPVMLPRLIESLADRKDNNQFTVVHNAGRRLVKDGMVIASYKPNGHIYMVGLPEWGPPPKYPEQQAKRIG